LTGAKPTVANTVLDDEASIDRYSWEFKFPCSKTKAVHGLPHVLRT